MTRYYAVVGLLERKSESDLLLEALVPRFFRGLSSMEVRKPERERESSTTVACPDGTF